jgi:hypothetical protein
MIYRRSIRDLRRDLEDLQDTEARRERLESADVGDVIGWYEENDPDVLADAWRAALTGDGDGDGGGGEQ